MRICSRTIVVCACLLALLGVGRAAADPATVSPGEETLLMFVGEAAPVVTVASRTAEAATSAPAVVDVVEREQIERRGYQTLAELLRDQPGFYIATAGRGSVPYLRGLRDSVLFLYDGVPLTTDVTKSFAPIDAEISLDSVERVEIVRGPGSVLWGADAFAGVVNIVPRQAGRSVTELAAQGGNEDHLAAFAANSLVTGDWKSFVSLRETRQSYHQRGYNTQTIAGELHTDNIDPSRYTEAVASLDYADWLHISGRWSDFNRRYTMRSADGTLSWDGEKQAPVNLLKASVTTVHGSSHYALSAYLQETDYQVRDANIERRQRNRVSHVELLWDRRMFGRGLLTVGLSRRWNNVNGAVVRDGFLPVFLTPELPLFVPKIEQKDFSSHLNSVYGQFRYRFAATQLWAGLRLDDQSQYRNAVSYSLGVNHAFSDQLSLKCTFGTAYRSPYSSQLFGSDSIDPEAIRTVSAQLAWDNSVGTTMRLTLFHARLTEHRVEDVYGGLSAPSKMESYGGELEAATLLPHHLRLSGSVGITGGNRARERFKTVKYAYIRPDGSQVVVYDQWQEKIDHGPDWQARLRLGWQPAPGYSLDISVATSDKISFSYAKGTYVGSYHAPVLVDLAWRCPGFASAAETLSLHINNLLDQDYRQPDVYGAVTGPGIQVMLEWQLKL